MFYPKQHVLRIYVNLLFMCIVIITSIIRIYSEFIFVLFTELFIKHNIINWIYFEAIKVCIIKLIQYLYFNMFLLLLF